MHLCRVNIKAPLLKLEYIKHSTVHWMYSNWTPLANTIKMVWQWCDLLGSKLARDLLPCSHQELNTLEHHKQTAAEDIDLLHDWADTNTNIWEIVFCWPNAETKEPSCCFSTMENSYLDWCWLKAAQLHLVLSFSVSLTSEYLPRVIKKRMTLNTNTTSYI